MKKTNEVLVMGDKVMEVLQATIALYGNMEKDINAVVLNDDDKKTLLGTLEREAKELLDKFTSLIKSTYPISEAYRNKVKQYENLLHIASLGGASTAHYSNAEVERAFREYKTRNKGKSAWDAANALIRPGAALSEKWHHVNSPWNRIKRIAESQQGITREEWYNDL